MRIIVGGVLASALMMFPPAPLDEAADRIVVNKSQRELQLIKRGQVIRSYRVSLGRNPLGPKQQQGDGRTPEGAYTISGRNPKSAFHLSLRISYPDAADRACARRLAIDPGGDIMIHGLPNEPSHAAAAHRSADWTEGCIAVSNDEIEEIWRLVPDGTPILINP